MITFNLLLFIFGIVLIALGASAKTQYHDLNHYVDNWSGWSVGPASLLIAVGVFIVALSFVGCFGAVRESYGILITFAVLLGIVFVLQFSGAIAMYVQRNSIMKKGESNLYEMIRQYNNASTEYNSTASVNTLQKEVQCCGINTYQDWFDPSVVLVANLTVRTVPYSCCRSDDLACLKQNLTSAVLNPVCSPLKLSSCPIYTRGCNLPVLDVVSKALKVVAGAAIAFAIIELIGVGFSAYLAKRIRSGYTYA